MGIFGNSSPFDEDIEKATSENNTSEQWGVIMELCDRISGGGAAAAREALRGALRRLAHPDPHVALQAATLLDACVANCGRPFKLEVASRDFEAEFRRILQRAQPPVAARLRQMLKKWADGEFKGDAQLDLIPALHARLKAGTEAPPTVVTPATSAAAAERREQDELARAIALSLKESSASTAPASAAAAAAAAAPTLYPRVEEPPPVRHVRALYDFEAAEDNELTFLAGELVHVTDSSDPNWWRGYNDRGEGLFPANFVTFDLTEPQPLKSERSGKSVQFAAGAGPAGAGAGGAGTEDSSEESDVIAEAELDAALAALHDADPEAGVDEETEVLSRLERRAARQGTLVDAALQRADRRHARLTQLSAELVDALNLYHELMRVPPPPPGLASQPAFYVPPNAGGVPPPPR